MGTPQQPGDARSPQQQQQWDQAEASLLEGLYQMAVDGRTETSECSRLASDVYRRLEAAYSDEPPASPEPSPAA